MKPKSNFSLILKFCVAGFILLWFVTLYTSQTPQSTQAAATAEQKIFLPLVANPYSFYKQPNPLNLPITLDFKRKATRSFQPQNGEIQKMVELNYEQAVESIIPVTGSVITATAADGARFILEIPEGALINETNIMMIPVTAINGQPLGGSSGAAVQMQPEGLQFYKPVTLRIEPSVAVPVDQEMTYSWQGDGQEFHQYPLELDYPYPQVVFRLMHFSGKYIGDGISIPVIDNPPIPTDPEAQFKHAAAELVRRERESLANGNDPDPIFHNNMIELLLAYYYQVIRPLMEVSETDCSFSKSGAVSKGLAWERTAETLKRGDELGNELEEFKNSFRAALENCWKEATEPCLNKNDVAQMQNVFWIAREGQQLGLDFNPNDVPECKCSGYWNISAWELTFDVSYNRQVQAQEKDTSANISIDRRQSGTIMLGYKKGYPPFPDWEKVHDSAVMPQGTASINDSATEYSNGDTYNYSTSASGITGGDAMVSFNELDCLYDLKLFITTSGTDSSPSKSEERSLNVIDILILDRDAHTDPNNIVLRGEGDFDAYTGAYIREGMFLYNGEAADVLYYYLMEAVGTGHASWTLRAVP